MSSPLRDGDPSSVGPYQLRGWLGGGGMGRVFLGRSPGGHTVAVKVVNSELANDPRFRDRFGTEVAAARRVGGFYTAQVVDSDTEADCPWLATAYIPGPSLYEAVEQYELLPVESVATLGAGLAEGLAAIHARNLVHRDLKPANVILAADGPRVIDFGIARALDTTSHTQTRTVLGTAAFMAPEQARGEEVSPATDVFALGCVLAYAATGRSPFGAGRPEAVTYRVVHEHPDLSDVPAMLGLLLAECLDKSPQRRPDLDEILEELNELIEELNELSGPATGPAEGHWLPSAITDVVAHRTAAVNTLPPTRRLPSTPEKPVEKSKKAATPPKKATHGGTSSTGSTKSPSGATPSTTEKDDTSDDGGGWWATGIGAAIVIALYLFNPGFSTWASQWLNDGTNGLGVGDCAAVVDGVAVEVPCLAAAADYTVAGTPVPIDQTAADDDDPYEHECDEVAGWDDVTGSIERVSEATTACLVPTE